MGFQGDNNQFEAGSIFVDTVEARDALRTRYQLRHTEVLDTLLQGGLTENQKTKLQREYRGLRSAINNVNIINPDAEGFNNQQNRAPDILFVKGHGNPNNANSISTVMTPIDERVQNIDGNQTDMRIKRGFRATHTAEEIGTSINNISQSVNSPGLDVRITSCGSGGTVSRDDVQIQPRDLTQTFAGQVSSQLDELGADPRINVSGYQGDTNSTHPSVNRPLDGFTTKIKQRTANLDNSGLFQNAIDRQTATLGALTEVMEPIKTRVHNQDDINVVEQHNDFQLSQANTFGMSHALQQRIQTFTKITTTNPQQQHMVAYGPRMRARIQIPRQDGDG